MNNPVVTHNRGKKKKKIRSFTKCIWQAFRLPLNKINSLNKANRGRVGGGVGSGEGVYDLLRNKEKALMGSELSI